jgi:PBSX family phage terminase large subunit
MGRKDLQEFKSTTLKEFLDVYEEAILDHNKQDRVIFFTNGTEIYYTNLDDSRDALNKIASLNLGAAVVDQCEEISQIMFETIKGRLRRQNARRCFYGAANPNGHDWIYEDFFELPYRQYALSLKLDIERANSICETLNKVNYMLLEDTYKKFATEENLAAKQIQTLHNKYQYEGFISTSLDNPYLPNDTLQSYLNLPDKVKKRYVYCSFDDFTGNVYAEFTEQKNKIPVHIPQSYEKKYIVLDYGFRNPTSVGFYSVDYDGYARRYDEIYLAETLIHDIATEIKKRDPDYRTSVKLADPSIFNVQRDGKSVADDYIREGLVFLPADNDVSQGINKVNQLLKDGTLLICENCTNWFWERDRYKWKDLKPGQARNEYEEPVKKNDHTMDETRYFVNYIWSPKEKKEEKPVTNRQAAVNLSKQKTITRF